MKKKSTPITLLLLFILIWLPTQASIRSSLRPVKSGQPDPFKFYVKLVVLEIEVKNAEEILGAPDGRYVEILPGGQLIVIMEETFVSMGMLVCKQDSDYHYSLQGWFPVGNTQDDEQNFAWEIFGGQGYSTPEMRPGEFKFPMHPRYPFRSTGVDRIKIINTSPSSLFIDAVIGYGLGETSVF